MSRAITETNAAWALTDSLGTALPPNAPISVQHPRHGRKTTALAPQGR